MHRINKAYRIIALLAGMFSCITPYVPDIEPSEQDLYVVMGQVTDSEGYQYASVSISSETADPRFIPVAGCLVFIHDDEGQDFLMEDLGNGDYRAWIGQEALAPGRSYHLRVITPSGEEILSAADTMPESPEIGAVYFQLETLPTSDPANPLEGIRFYADLDATGTDSRYFRWELEETYEYHMDYAREWYYDGTTHKVDPPDKSTQVCWYTSAVKDIFTLSTENLSQNTYTAFPLHFVDNTTHKLTVMYSLLVRQFALSEAAFLFWDKLRTNSQSAGGLYEKQPLPVDGNLYLSGAPGKRVLGFFSAVSVKTGRIFIENVEGLILDPAPLCIGPVPLGIFGWSEFDPSEYPIWFTRIDGQVHTLEDRCIDCRLSGGVNVKPGFWP